MPYLPAVRRGTCGRHQQPVGEGDFTHPRVGQAEHLACRKRPPNAFCGQKPAPTSFIKIKEQKKESESGLDHDLLLVSF